jgi:hypothetical protein
MLVPRAAIVPDASWPLGDVSCGGGVDLWMRGELNNWGPTRLSYRSYEQGSHLDWRTGDERPLFG